MRAELTKRPDLERPGIRARADIIRVPLPNTLDWMGVAHGPLWRRHSGRGRAVPERPPVDPSPFVPQL